MIKDSLASNEVNLAASNFHRDGFVIIKNVLSAKQLVLLQQGIQQVSAKILESDPKRVGNRGHHRYSLENQIHHPAWQQLIDIPAIIAIL